MSLNKSNSTGLEPNDIAGLMVSLREYTPDRVIQISP